MMHWGWRWSRLKRWLSDNRWWVSRRVFAERMRSVESAHASEMTRVQTYCDETVAKLTRLKVERLREFTGPIISVRTQLSDLLYYGGYDTQWMRYVAQAVGRNVEREVYYLLASKGKEEVTK